MRVLALLLALLFVAGRAHAQGGAIPDGFVLVWEEGFDVRDAAFEARWDVGTHTFDGNEAQFVEENVVVEDGLLKLRLTDEPAGTRMYSGAELRTDNETGFFTYGRFEARMKAATGSGVISSLFTYRYQPWQEVDIEFKGRDTHAMQANIFYNGGAVGDPNNDPYEAPPFPEDAPLPYDAAESFHVYAFEWEPGIVRWFVDGEQVLESQNPAEVPTLPQQLMMNVWITDLPWAGPLAPTAVPAEAQYDWVRVYRRDTGPVFDSFDDGDVSDLFVFSETGGGIGVGPIDDANGAPDRAVNVGVEPAETGAYAGVVFPGGAGVTDASEATALTFQLRPLIQASNLPLTLEINLHEDVNGNGVYDGALEDEYQATYAVAGPSDYLDVSIPFSAFAHDDTVFPGAGDGFDYARLLEIVVAIADPTGPGYALSFDEIAFTLAPTSAEAPPEAFAAAPVVYPNPATDAVTLAFELAAPSDVSLEVFDLMGRRVAELSAGPQAAGAVRLGVPTRELAPGVYLVRLRTQMAVVTMRFSVVR